MRVPVAGVVPVDPGEVGGEIGERPVALAEPVLAEVQQVDGAPRVVLHPGGALAALGAVALQRGLDARPLGGEVRGQRGGVLDGLVGALALMRQHRVGGVAQQDHAPAVPLAQRPVVVQRPARALGDRPDHLADGRMPAGEALGGFRRVALLHPGVGLPARHARHRQEVHDPAAVDRVVQQVRTRAGPELDRAGLGEAREVLGGDQAAVADRAAEDRVAVEAERAPDHRMHAVGGDHDVGLHALAVLELQPAGGVHARHAVPEVQAIGIDPVGEQLEQRHAVHPVVGGAERVRVGVVLAHRVAADQLAVVAAADAQRRRLRRDGGQRVTQAQAHELADAVGRERDGGADLAQLGGLLVDVGLDAAVGQRPRQGQAADAAAGDSHRQRSPHGSTVAALRAKYKCNSRSIELGSHSMRTELLEAASTTAARAKNAMWKCPARNESAYVGDSARRISGLSAMPPIPHAAMVRNHAIITGPKSRPTVSVPRRWNRNSTSVINAMMPPSPSLSARMTSNT
jgi:hypothetical protein